MRRHSVWLRTHACIETFPNTSSMSVDFATSAGSACGWLAFSVSCITCASSSTARSSSSTVSTPVVGAAPSSAVLAAAARSVAMSAGRGKAPNAPGPRSGPTTVAAATAAAAAASVRDRRHGVEEALPGGSPSAAVGANTSCKLPFPKMASHSATIVFLGLLAFCECRGSDSSRSAPTATTSVASAPAAAAAAAWPAATAAAA
mmetsp:Transcript_28055/g.65798  ORF Transcript_28055/g.65798 Transcript_28055/m.65798 type:complete len:203 (+) Transcript_28055:2879-3487(+)